MLSKIHLNYNLKTQLQNKYLVRYNAISKIMISRINANRKIKTIYGHRIQELIEEVETAYGKQTLSNTHESYE